MAFVQKISFLLFIGLAIAGCKFVPTAEKQKQGSINSAQAPDKGFDAQVAEIWDAKLTPYVTAKAGTFNDVVLAIESNPDQAGAKYGYKEKGGSSPWTVLTKIDGTIVAANTESRAATIDVDTTGDGKPDAQIQIGPVIRGTAIRDSLDFVNFNSFTNQIDFAQFGKAFNTYANEKVLKEISRDALIGKPVKVLGAFAIPQGSSLPLVTPIMIQVGS